VLEQLVGRDDQVPFVIEHLNRPQQESAQAPDFLDLPFHPLHDHLALAVDLLSHLTSEPAYHPLFNIGMSGQRTPLRWLTMGQATGDDVGVNVMITSGPGVFLVPVARIKGQHLRQFKRYVTALDISCSTSGG